MDFQGIKFSGTFRPYQQRVIDNSDKYLKKNKKIHIVAAPGSGKTILGLELIRRLGKPALVLSPTIAIREQWKERFEEMYVPADKKVDDYVSCTLLKPKLLTSITYQGLYTSYRKAAVAPKPSADESDEVTEAEFENYSSVNIIDLMKEKKISVICLDEAHHLRAEWQKALYEFVERVEHSVTIIALTATPPYDSKKAEWDKYIAMCGPIDEEIFVPELVRAKTLCPHQDYIYYNFPTEAEQRIIEQHKTHVEEVVKAIFAERKFLDIIMKSPFYLDPPEFEDELSDKTILLCAILSFLDENKVKPPKELTAMLERGERTPDWDLSVAEILFQGMINDDQLFTAPDRDFVLAYLSRHGLIEKREVKLITSEEVEKLLFTSIGKLHSIARIAGEEWKNLGEKIRLLILTDYIRVNSQVLGTDKEIKEMGVVPVFELLRRQNLGMKLAAISGKIVIVPNVALDGIRQVAEKDKARMRVVPIKDTEHSELKFEGANSAQKISVITKAFNAGIINGIVGTKSLLGEGWDSPVINTLILASCVGSFMLSNQMRGRAIRIDKNCPEKTSNIWHLTAILPEHLMADVAKDVPPSDDYATLERRFKSFMGLSYDEDVIESSLTRASTLDAPYNQDSVNDANQKTFKLASKRDETNERWQSALKKSSNEVIIQNEIPKPRKGFIPAMFIKPSHYAVIKKIAHAVMKTFKELSLIDKRAKPMVEKDYKAERVNVGIARCTKYEKNIFHQAISEVLDAIQEPKYILIKSRKGKPDYRCAFAVPEIFSNKKQNAEVFCEKMCKRIADFELYFTRTADGKKHLAQTKKKAYVNKANLEIAARMKLRPK
ncbi:MAG: DEAD/DEAH box helicase family protein [Christensenellaceae bacterium]|jgi:superfamily II DNA or RNA helicase|nr:DEAD/DEAH box helicase family protein [Christensenellaceae bacterium]